MLAGSDGPTGRMETSPRSIQTWGPSNSYFEGPHTLFQRLSRGKDYRRLPVGGARHAERSGRSSDVNGSI